MPLSPAAIAALLEAAPLVARLFLSFLHGAGLPEEQALAMTAEFLDALGQIAGGASPESIAAGPARYAKPLEDDGLFDRLLADARAGVGKAAP